MTTTEGGIGRTEAPANVRPEVVEITGIEDLRACVDLERTIWGAGDIDLVPLNQLRAAQQAGGLVAGARLSGKLVGFSYAFPAYRPRLHNGPGLHSHLTGVLEAVRGMGVGRALKEFQRSWCLERGIGWIEWTFDPLRAANARFNLNHLGAAAEEYLVDVYGRLDDGLNRALPSDRLVASWRLDDYAGAAAIAQGAAAIAQGAADKGPVDKGPVDKGPANQRPADPGPANQGPADPGAPEHGVPVLTASEQDLPGIPRLGETADALLLAVPGDLDRLLATRPEAALRWRLAVRAAFRHYFASGYRTTRFLDSAYLLTRRQKEPQ
ncbi:MAG TPA: GNAT family N-acetyltransferase [Trueperaceae bacterium]